MRAWIIQSSNYVKEVCITKREKFYYFYTVCGCIIMGTTLIIYSKLRDAILLE